MKQARKEGRKKERQEERNKNDEATNVSTRKKVDINKEIDE